MDLKHLNSLALLGVRGLKDTQSKMLQLQTSKGRRYVDHNPKLHNPIDWEKVAAIAAIISVIVAVIALFIACSAIKQNNS